MSRIYTVIFRQTQDTTVDWVVKFPRVTLLEVSPTTCAYHQCIPCDGGSPIKTETKVQQISIYVNITIVLVVTEVKLLAWCEITTKQNVKIYWSRNTNVSSSVDIFIFTSETQLVRVEYKCHTPVSVTRSTSGFQVKVSWGCQRYGWGSFDDVFETKSRKNPPHP